MEELQSELNILFDDSGIVKKNNKSSTKDKSNAKDKAKDKANDKDKVKPPKQEKVRLIPLIRTTVNNETKFHDKASFHSYL